MISEEPSHWRIVSKQHSHTNWESSMCIFLLRIFEFLCDSNRSCESGKTQGAIKSFESRVCVSPCRSCGHPVPHPLEFAPQAQRGWEEKWILPYRARRTQSFDHSQFVSRTFLEDTRLGVLVLSIPIATSPFLQRRWMATSIGDVPWACRQSARICNASSHTQKAHTHVGYNMKCWMLTFIPSSNFG